MKPDAQAVLAQTAQALMTVHAPQAAAPYYAAQLGMTAINIGMMVEEWERAAQRRVEENAAIRGLFGRAAGLGLEPGLAARLAGLATGAEPDLRISTLEAANTTLRAALIDLQAAVETRADGPAQALNDAIWAELSASTVRRGFAGATF
jgi:hypothetical protein